MKRGLLNRKSKKKSKKGSQRKAFWESEVGDNPTRKEKPVKKKKVTPKKVTKVKEKKKPAKKIRARGKDVKVEKKTDRSVREAKVVTTLDKVMEDYKTMEKEIKRLMVNPHFGEWLQNYCYKKMEKQATSRGQIPTKLPEFQVLQRSQSSTELKRDAKGKVVFTVKAYADTSFESAKEAINTYLQIVKSVGNDEDE